MTDETYRRDILRIEAKIDQLQQAVVSLARIEERQSTMVAQAQAMVGDLRDLSRRVTDLERTNHGRAPLYRWLNVGGVAALGAAIGALFKGWQG